ncbi:MAG: hypothetical protein LBS77_04445 [Desulfovibrio sp.]|jgi:hypothetical protein|nr:hypothetical protein [Desulfovibrio sp.]
MTVLVDTLVLRRRRRLFGRVCAVFIAAALFCLADGLYSAVRVGSDVVELLPGRTLMLSGPSPMKTPLNSDFTAQISPDGDDLHFILEGFFASYWFGSAMWRGAVEIADNAKPGRYELLIKFRGSPAKSAQKIFVVIWEDEAAMRAGSTSSVRRLTGVSPVVPGIVCGVVGLLLGIFTFLWGKQYLKTLSKLGYSEIFRVAVAGNDYRFFCLANGLRTPREGSHCHVFTPEGQELGQALTQTATKGILEFSIPKNIPVRSGCLVELHSQP